jgi:cation diffusion facilitator family transporter
MKFDSGFELPPDKQTLMARARRLEWITLAYILSATAIVAFVLGQSQSMKTAWMDDLLSLIPIAVFLIGSRISQWEPNERFPYGYHRVTSAAYLAAAVALTVVGLYLLVESVINLIRAEHPTIGAIELFGHQVWLGWLMIPALLYSMVPAIILSRMKLPVAEALYDKVIYTDAAMNKADWLTEAAAIVGILGIGFGYWWTDAVAATFISFDIVRDGSRHLRVSLFDLIDHRPLTIDGARPDPVIAHVKETVEGLDWVKAFDVRLRVNGHTLSGEALVVPNSTDDLPERIERAMRKIRALDWRLHHFAITPVTSLGPDTKDQDETRN